MKLVVGVCAFCVGVSTASAQIRPSVTEIVKNVGDTWGTASQYEYEATVTQAIAGSNDKMVSEVHAFYRAPDKYRYEMTTTQIGRQTINFGKLITVDDGSRLWDYNTPNKRYSVHVHSAAPTASRTRPDSYIIATYLGFEHQFETAKLLREERIATPAGDADCFVLEDDLHKMAWIAKSDFHIVRFVNPQGYEEVFKVIKFNERIPDEVFKFEPPAGATERK
jgi:outer membrane lipoprotein-sorting protein